MSTTKAAPTAQGVKPGPTADEDARLACAARELNDRFGIEHVTVQIERAAGHCRQAPEDVVQRGAAVQMPRRAAASGAGARKCHSETRWRAMSFSGLRAKRVSRMSVSAW
jgi:hypothetical protein